MNVFEGNVVAKDVRIGIVAARFNEFITSKLLGGAVDALKRHEVEEDQIENGPEQKVRCSDLPWGSNPGSDDTL